MNFEIMNKSKRFVHTIKILKQPKVYCKELSCQVGEDEEKVVQERNPS